MSPDSIICWLPGPTFCSPQRFSLTFSKVFLRVDRIHTTDNGRWRRFSADGLNVNNQTNLAIKGIIAIEAMSKMSSVVNQTSDANKYSVCTGFSYAIQ